MRKEGSFLPLAAPPTLVALVILSGCGASGNATPILQQIFPERAYSDVPLQVRLLGGPFHPPVQLDTTSSSADVVPSPFQISLEPVRPAAGRHPVAAINPTWSDQNEIDATLPAGLLAGSYAVTLRDAAENVIPSSASFTSLGPDIDAPHIVFLQPPELTTYAPGESFVVDVRIDDGAGQLGTVQWSASLPATTPTPCSPNALGVCQFELVAQAGPDVVDPIDIRIDAEDALHNRATVYRRVRVAWMPTVTSLEPREGSTNGGTTIKVSGQNFVPGLSQITVDCRSNGGVIDPSVDCPSIGGVVDAGGRSITATTTAHIPGDALVAVSNGHSIGTGLPRFKFIPPPILKLIDPPHAVADMPTMTIAIAGNNFRPETEFSWLRGDSGAEMAISYAPLENVAPVPPYERLLSQTKVELVLLPGAGTISIRAHDPVSGDSTLLDAFTFDLPP